MAGIIVPPSSLQSPVIHINIKNTSISPHPHKNALAFPILSGSGSSILLIRSKKRLETTPFTVLSQNNSVTSVEFSDNSEQTKSPIIAIDNYDSFTYNLCQVHPKIQGYHYKLYWNLDQLYHYLVFVWVCNASERLLEEKLCVLHMG